MRTYSSSVKAIENHVHYLFLIFLSFISFFVLVHFQVCVIRERQLISNSFLKWRHKFFTEPPSRVIFFYKIYQEKFAQMEETLENITFLQGLPHRSDIEKYASSERHLLLVFDDMYKDVISSRDISDLTIMYSHHLNTSVIFCSHNIFESG